MNDLNVLIISLLSNYRSIPAMFRSLQGEGFLVTRAQKDLARTLSNVTGIPVEYKDIPSLLKPYENWIKFAIHDFKFYADNLLEKNEERPYWERMAEEANLVTSILPFKLPMEKPVIIDIGGGSAPYVRHFAEANQCHIDYLALDKREEVNELKSCMGVSIIPIHTIDFFVTLKCLPKKPNVLFMANFLHCTPAPEITVMHILERLPSIEVVKILEVKGHNTLDILFDYHMAEHCMGGRVGLKEISAISGWSIKAIEELGGYHLLYTLVPV